MRDRRDSTYVEYGILSARMSRGEAAQIQTRGRGLGFGRQGWVPASLLVEPYPLSLNVVRAEDVHAGGRLVGLILDLVREDADPESHRDEAVVVVHVGARV